jgi:hypothetical protein
MVFENYIKKLEEMSKDIVKKKHNRFIGHAFFQKIWDRVRD